MLFKTMWKSLCWKAYIYGNIWGTKETFSCHHSLSTRSATSSAALHYLPIIFNTTLQDSNFLGRDIMMFLKNVKVVNNSVMPFTRRGIQQKLSDHKYNNLSPEATITEYTRSDIKHKKVNSKIFAGVSVCMILLMPFLYRYLTQIFRSIMHCYR